MLSECRKPSTFSYKAIFAILALITMFVAYVLGAALPEALVAFVSGSVGYAMRGAGALGWRLILAGVLFFGCAAVWIFSGASYEAATAMLSMVAGNLFSGQKNGEEKPQEPQDGQR